MNGYNASGGINPAMLSNMSSSPYPNQQPAQRQFSGPPRPGFNTPGMYQNGQQPPNMGMNMNMGMSGMAAPGQPGMAGMGGQAANMQQMMNYQRQLSAQQNGQASSPMSNGMGAPGPTMGGGGGGGGGMGYGGDQAASMGGAGYGTQPLQPQHSGGSNMGMGANTGGMASAMAPGAGSGGAYTSTGGFNVQQLTAMAQFARTTPQQIASMPPKNQQALASQLQKMMQQPKQGPMGGMASMGGMQAPGMGGAGTMGMNPGMNGMQGSPSMPQGPTPGHMGMNMDMGLDQMRPSSSASATLGQPHSSPPTSANGMGGMGGMGPPMMNGMPSSNQNGYGSGAGAGGMPMPPPPSTPGMSHVSRPSTAQGGQTYPRPGTSMSMHGGTPGPGSMSGAAGSPTPSTAGMGPMSAGPGPASATTPGRPQSAMSQGQGQGQGGVQNMMGMNGGVPQTPTMPSPSQPRMGTPADAIQRPPTAPGSASRPGTSMGGGMQNMGMAPGNGMGAMAGMGNMGGNMSGNMNGSMGMARPPSVAGGTMGGTPAPGMSAPTSMQNGMPGMNMGMGMGMTPGATGMRPPMSAGMSSGFGMGLPGPVNSLQHPSLTRSSSNMSAAAPLPGSIMGSMVEQKPSMFDGAVGAGGPDPLVGMPPSMNRQPSLPSFNPAPAGAPPQHTPMSGPTGMNMPPLSRDGSRAAMPSAPPGPSTTAAPATGLQLDPRRTKLERGAPEPLTDEQVASVRSWMDADDTYRNLRRDRHQALMQEAGAPFGDLRTGLGLRAPVGPAWYERPVHQQPPPRRGKFGIEWGSGLAKNKEKEIREAKEREKRKEPRRREGVKAPSKLNKKDADKPEVIVPIRLDFDVDNQKMRDTFTWNLNDPVITPEMFAQTIVDDYGLAQNFHSVITKAIQDQLSDFQAHSHLTSGDGTDEKAAFVRKGTFAEEDAKWWKQWRAGAPDRARAARGASPRKRRKVDIKLERNIEDGVGAIALDEEPLNLDGFEFDEGTAEDDMRIVIRLDVIVGSMKLEDQIEWDLENEDASPEAFAEIYARDLGLTGEFKTAVIHQIREQIASHKKTLFITGGVTGFMADEELRTAVLPSLSSGARAIDQVTSFTPLLNYVSDSEIEKSERDREKEIVRRRKRGNRGRRGVAMPDREPQRTYRTPGIGFAPIDPANLTAQAILAGPMSRRAAAAAAQINIANMVASENRPEDMEPSNSPITSLHVLPSQNAASSREAKEAKKKSKGLFVAPEYPSSILHARAQVKAPTDAVAFERGPMISEEFVDHDLPPSMVSRPPDSSRGNGQAWSAKRARELEREAKEQEYMDGQHPNMIDGEWHCSNCGCPASIAIGRRKGPLGEKTQCGICGKYWHRHRKPRPVEYHSDLAYHQNLKDEAVRAKQSARSKKRAPAAAAALERETSEVDLSPTKTQVFVEIPSRPRSITRIQSPMSSDDSGDEAPLASKGKRNGSSAPPDGVSTPALGNEAGSPNQFGIAPPSWLVKGLGEILRRYPKDRVEITLKNFKAPPTDVPEWRLRCHDCPGKLYNHGPGESVDNFEVHIKNRHHRSKVNDRLAGYTLDM